MMRRIGNRTGSGLTGADMRYGRLVSSLSAILFLSSVAPPLAVAGPGSAPLEQHRGGGRQEPGLPGGGAGGGGAGSALAAGAGGNAGAAGAGNNGAATGAAHHAREMGERPTQ